MAGSMSRPMGTAPVPDEAGVELVAIHGESARGLRPGSGVAERGGSRAARRRAPRHHAAPISGPARGEGSRTPILRRSEAGRHPGTGPLIIEEYDATCLVLPGWRADLDSAGNIALEQ